VWRSRSGYWGGVQEFRRFAVEDQGGEEFMVQSAGESVRALVTS
jgi:hypothetical protein